MIPLFFSKFSRLICFSACCLFVMMGCNDQSEPKESETVSRFQKNTFTQSNFIDDKIYEVYLPASYSNDSEKRYPVLYMMDRQNLFVDSLAYGGAAWNIHEVTDDLSQQSKLKEIIIVGVDHAGVNRFSEYMPQKPLEALPSDYRDSMLSFLQRPVFSDSFLLFLTKELKPLIDKEYRTLPDMANTFIGGSSMGGLISMYAQCEYPSIFGGALCLSTHWPIAMDDSSPAIPAQLIQYFASNLPKDKMWYFDHGTKGLDQYYEPYQQKIDSVLMASGYSMDESFLSKKFEGHDHNEKDWNERLNIPLEFVIGK